MRIPYTRIGVQAYRLGNFRWQRQAATGNRHRQPPTSTGTTGTTGNWQSAPATGTGTGTDKKVYLRLSTSAPRIVWNLICELAGIAE